MSFWAELREGLAFAGDAIRANRLRSILTTLGIVVGIATVTLMGTAIDGMHRAFVRSVSAIGADVLYVERRGWFIDTPAGWRQVFKRQRISLNQARAMAKQLQHVRAVAPVVEAGLPMTSRNRETSSVRVIGTTDQFLATSGATVALGRFISADESEGGRPVCVIGAQVATNLFSSESPLGQKVRLRSSTFEVIGVLDKQGSILGMISLDNQVFIPIKQFASEFWSDLDCSIRIKAARLDQLDETKEEVRGVMRKVRHLAPVDPDDFAINQQEMFIKMFDKVTAIIGSTGLFITGLSLFVGGIGIMNIMFVSVAERTREIGIRKAIGAKRRSILLQFLLEAISLCLLGGLIALAIAWPLTFAMRTLLPASLSLSIAGLALGVAAFTGMIAGLLPAWRAARLDPVDALRTE